MKKIIFGFLASSLLPASATVTLNIQGGTFRDNAGASIPTGSVVALVADLDGTGFDFDTNSLLGVIPSIGGTIGDNLILGLSSTSDANGPALIDSSFAGISLENGLDTGDNLAFVWFSGLTNGSAIEDGQSVGTFTETTVDVNSGGNNALVVPADGSLVTIAYFDDTIAGSSVIARASDFTAQQFVAVPEPSTALLGLIGLAGILRRRR